MPRHATVADVEEPDQTILSPKDTSRLTSLSSATIWRLRRLGDFPDPVRLSPGRMGWRRRDIEAWCAAREGIAGYLRPSPNPRVRALPDPVPVTARRRKR